MPRKVPFSGKQKKAQLTAKRNSKALRNKDVKKAIEVSQNESDSSSEGNIKNESVPISVRLKNAQKLNVQPSRDNRSKPNRYALQFYRETEKELRTQKEEARKKYEKLCETSLEISDDVFNGFDFPKRPDWNYDMTKTELERIENSYFNDYIMKLDKKYEDKSQMSYFELNLETWRQLWRVLEISDVILIIVDIRYPNLMFPPALHKYITEDLNKNIILVLNKIDLAPATVVLAWKKFFEEKYKNLSVVLFTAFPSYNLRGKQETKNGLKLRRKRGKPKMAAECALEILKKCKEIVKDEVDLTLWEQKILEEMNLEIQCNEDDEMTTEIGMEIINDNNNDEFDFKKREKYNEGVLSIGCVGFPNVGKSSLLNALMGKKVVSVSRTPGHTKHFQTIFLTNNVKLCDCPGLVFPSATPRMLQVLMGSYPIAQLREPYGSIKFLGERIDLPLLLGIHQESDDDDNNVGNDNKHWSAIDICDAWALKRGFLTARAARPDTYRAANSILRMALDGKLSLCLRPPGFADNPDKWLESPEIENVKYIQGMNRSNDKNSSNLEEDNGDDEDIFTSDEETPMEAETSFPIVSNKFELLNDD